MNMIGYYLAETRFLKSQVLGRQWFAPKLVPCVDQTDACKAVPCRNYPARFRIGYGLDASTVSASRRNRWYSQASRCVADSASQSKVAIAARKLSRAASVLP